MIYQQYSHLSAVSSSQFLSHNGYIIPFALSLVFVLNHYVILAVLLTYWMKSFVMGGIGGSRDDEGEEDEQEEEQRSALWLSGAEEKKDLSPKWVQAIKNQPFLYLFLAPLTFLCTFLINCVAVPIIDTMMLCFDVIAFYVEERDDTNYNPLNNLFINFLLQYRTVRVPLEVLLQSLPQTILSAYMYRYVVSHPPTADAEVAHHEFSAQAVAQALTASVLNLIVNGITIYISSKTSGRSFFGYLGMTMQFEGSAQLPPEWDERTTSRHTVVEGNYHVLKLAQQMKILQIALRRPAVKLRTSGLMGQHPDALHNGSSIPSGTIVVDNRKMLDFLFEWNAVSQHRRLPHKIHEINAVRDKNIELTVLFHQLHRLPFTSNREITDVDMGISTKNIATNVSQIPTELVALWLISDIHVVDSITIVRLNDCNIDASYMLPTHDQGYTFVGPLVELLKSKTLKILDLNKNPLFQLLRTDYDHQTVHGGQNSKSVDEADHYYDLQQEAATNFAVALRANTSLLKLFLSETRMDVFPALEVLRALSVYDGDVEPNSSLDVLDISHNHLLKDVSEDEVEEVTNCLTHFVARLSPLSELNMTATFLTPKQLHILIEEGLAHNKSIQKVELSEMKLTPKEALALKILLVNNQSLLSLSLRGTGLDSEGVGHIASALSGMHGNTTLLDLDLSCNPAIGDKGAELLSTALRSCRCEEKGLRVLSMSDTSLSRDGVEVICEALAAMTTLQALELDNSYLDYSKKESQIPPLECLRESVDSIIQVLQSNTRIKYLALSKCRICVQSAQNLSAEIALHDGLEGLDLSHNPFATDGMEKIANDLKNLKQLSLSAVNMTSLGFRQLLQVLQHNTCLTELDVTHNFIQSIDKSVFHFFNRDNSTLFRMDLRWNRLPVEMCATLSESFSTEAKAGALATRLMNTQSMVEKIKDLMDLEEEDDPQYELLV
ncbi:hypothetical protein CEUSTIGMA_g9014.t1 [Chlamydomonas eustigma]|uniref:Uncharacterized protein n=1 Tax=Chlamydomonas eustigma TaxID=1157962 RepID=A0A250XEX8_9CHLO|nr:hypothetical protein CEUSTIGMA_g9014.t1 [Chlamydomonas eustigma]|eukprot:GAX81586.1 hypothetical protein CEUSTIGMA_g9014.t1 [Chlamydomonas eustigma]